MGCNICILMYIVYLYRVTNRCCRTIHCPAFLSPSFTAKKRIAVPGLPCGTCPAVFGLPQEWSTESMLDDV